MATKTVFLALNGDKVIRASTNLKRFVGVSFFEKEYFYYYRKFKNCDEFYHTTGGGETIKIMKVNAD